MIAKPAEQTPLIAARAVALMHEAGVPAAAIQLLPGDGPAVGAPLTADPRIAGVCFTGSTEVAQIINRSMAGHLAPDAPLIAETGGLNAMIVDSTALPEQAVKDIVASAFQSAGQRCSALRILYVQKDVADKVLAMLSGAMDELQLGDPWHLSSDIGPVIDDEAFQTITAYCGNLEEDGRLIKTIAAPEGGRFVAPSVFRVSGIDDMDREIFGPVLHVATFAADEIDEVIDRINAKGYGLTFGLHTRVDSRVQQIVDRARVGNLYVNRNQIGAIVGSQPFGGEGLSGTGPKAGGPNYVRRFLKADTGSAGVAAGPVVEPGVLQSAIGSLDAAAWAERTDRAMVLRDIIAASGMGGFDLAQQAVELTGEARDLPGPTGESNRLSMHPRGVVLALGPDLEAARTQVLQALGAGNGVVVVCPGAGVFAAEFAAANGAIVGFDGQVDADGLRELSGIDAVAFRGDAAATRAIRQALAARAGPIIPLISEAGQPERYIVERHLCVDTTAAGGNASLLAATGG